jgi:hypothetical protein
MKAIGFVLYKKLIIDNDEQITRISLETHADHSIV